MQSRRLFTDEQVMTATEMSQENIRKLIQWGAVRPEVSGGGRGRQRKWTIPQANRIAVTAQFYNSGLSFRVAHTLAYALPLDDMLLYYDIEFWEQSGKAEEINWIIDPNGGSMKYRPDRIGHVILAHNRWVYTDALAQSPMLFGYLDHRKGKYISWHDPDNFMWGMVASTMDTAPKGVGVSSIDRTSLALEILPREQVASPGELPKIVSDDLLMYRPTYMLQAVASWPSNFTVIALYMGLSRTVRSLLGLSTQPAEIEHDDREYYDEAADHWRAFDPRPS